MNIIELAKQAHGPITGKWWDMDVASLERFAALVEAHESEACAKMVDHILKEGGGTWGEAIRARGTNMTDYPSKKAATQDKLSAAPDNFYTIKLPEQPEWKCYMFGNTPQDNQGIVYTPIKGKEPNWFVRWMMKVCFACTWTKEKNT